jgi:hypothetical protein
MPSKKRKKRVVPPKPEQPSEEELEYVFVERGGGENRCV